MEGGWILRGGQLGNGVSAIVFDNPFCTVRRKGTPMSRIYLTPRFGNWVTFRNQASEMTSVDCLSGEFAVGGGFVTTISTSAPSSTTQLVRTFVSAPSPTIRTRWFARAFNANEFDWAHLSARRSVFAPQLKR